METDVPSRGGWTAEPDGPQRLPDSELHNPVDEEISAGSPDGRAADLFPTDSKERERARKKALKAAGKEITVKKRKTVIEDHWDDCGEDLRGLKDINLAGAAWISHLDNDVEPLVPETAFSDVFDGMDMFMLYGSIVSEDMTCLTTVHLRNLDEFQQVYMNTSAKIEIAEICGGEA